MSKSKKRRLRRKASLTDKKDDVEVPYTEIVEKILHKGNYKRAIQFLETWQSDRSQWKFKVSPSPEKHTAQALRHHAIQRPRR